jgi:hydroxymethylbilane synthase
MLEGLGGGCQLPIAAYSKRNSSQLHLAGVVASPDGTRVLRASATGAPANPEDVGQRVAADLLRQGAGELLGQPELDPTQHS